MVKIIVFFVLLCLFNKPVWASINLSTTLQKHDGDYYYVDVKLSGAATGAGYYLQGMITKEGETKYFGRTWGRNNDFFNYLSTPSPDFIKENFPYISNDETKTIIVAPDYSDSDYTGSGDYLLGVKRYTGNSTTGTFQDSDKIPIILSAPSTPTIAPTETTSPTPTSTPTSTPTNTTTPTHTPTQTFTTTPTSSGTSSTPKATLTSIKSSTSATLTPEDEEYIYDPYILGTESAEISPADTSTNKKGDSLAFYISGGVITLTALIILVLYFKKVKSGIIIEE